MSNRMATSKLGAGAYFQTKNALRKWAQRHFWRHGTLSINSANWPGDGSISQNGGAFDATSTFLLQCASPQSCCKRRSIQRVHRLGFKRKLPGQKRGNCAANGMQLEQSKRWQDADCKSCKYHDLQWLAYGRPGNMECWGS